MAKQDAIKWSRVQPIGYVRRPGASDPVPGEFYDPNLETVIEILPRWADGLIGIEEFSHLVVLFWLDRMPRIDAWPNTPVLDIKGYFPRDELRADATVPDWLNTLWQRHDEERGR